MLSTDTVLQSRYRILRLLGKGGMGAVYEAMDERLNRRVALKQMMVTDERLRQAFAREAKLLANLRHPSLPNVIDWFDEDDNQFITMEYIAGDDLAVMIQKHGTPFPVEDVTQWADELLDALHYLHTQIPPILHRDVKPANLKITTQNRIILLDFGLAKGTAGDMTRLGADATQSVFGYTPQYAPLEQIQGEGTTERSDLYALAASLYHLLTNAKPPDALTRASNVIGGETGDPLKPLREINAGVPEAIERVIMRALALKPSARFASAAEMRVALRQARFANNDDDVTRIASSPIPPPFFPPHGTPNTSPQRVQPLSTNATTPNAHQSPPAPFTSFDTEPRISSASSRAWWVLAGFLSLVCVASLSFFLVRYANSTGPTETAPQAAVNPLIADVPEALRPVLPSIVALSFRDANNKVTNQASGFFINPDEVATSLAALDGATQVRVTPLSVSGARVDSFTANTVSYVDREQNLAILKVERGRGTPARINEQRQTSVGSRLNFLGAKSGGAALFSMGTVRGYRDDDTLEINAPLEAASLGGVALDDAGTIVGIVTSVRTNANRTASNVVTPIANLVAAMRAGANPASIAATGARDMLYDFRRSPDTKTPSLSPEAKARIIAATFPVATPPRPTPAPSPSDETNGNTTEDAIAEAAENILNTVVNEALTKIQGAEQLPDAEVIASATGAFTASGARETAYIVTKDASSRVNSPGSKKLAIFAADKLVVALDIQGDKDILKTTDLNLDGINELLLSGGTTNMGETEIAVRLVELRGRTLKEIYIVTDAYDDNCGGSDIINGGGSINVAAIYTAPTTRGRFPELRLDTFTAPCAQGTTDPRPEDYRYTASRLLTGK
ncbi:MAG: protein kinase [Pyrinomonadaceae bacterium MAG19_C2-C3]|nr:protein kinase [Pyrinomonadaceae bacterium MAG19_C2-C3]